jgi:hypothetical protein
MRNYTMNFAHPIPEDVAIAERLGIPCTHQSDARDAFQMRLRNSAGAVSSVRAEVNQGLFIPGAHWSA